MKLPELLIEYLIIGCFSLVWLIPLLIILNYFPNINNFFPVFAALLLPCTYVLGMVIDFLASTILKNKQKENYEKIKVKFKMTKQEIQMCFSHRYISFFIIKAPQILKESQSRGSRHRIARSTILNFFSILVTLIIYDIKHFTCTYPTDLKIICHLLVGVFFIFFSYKMWLKYHELFYSYVITAYRLLADESI
jgi:hypothetical protein